MRWVAERCAPEVRGSETPACAHDQSMSPEQSKPAGVVPPQRYGVPSRVMAAAIAAPARPLGAETGAGAGAAAGAFGAGG